MEQGQWDAQVLKVLLMLPQSYWAGYRPIDLPPTARRLLDEADALMLQNLLVEITLRLHRYCDGYEGRHNHQENRGQPPHPPPPERTDSRRRQATEIQKKTKKD
ncbi:MAG TPA: hypothetical protein VF184_11575 [Phycisphaeraceae bacterium]